jgi:hypothetical protein
MKEDRDAARRRSEESAELSRVLTEDLRAAVSVAKSTISSLEPDEINEQVLVDVAKGALADLDAAVERWVMLHELEEGEGSLAFIEPRGLVDDVLRDLIPELEEKELRVSIDDETGFREAPMDVRRLSVALRGILDAIVAVANRGDEVAVSIRYVLEGIGMNPKSPCGSATGECLVIEAIGRGVGSTAAASGASSEIPPAATPARSHASERRNIGLAVAKRLMVGRFGDVRAVEYPGRGSGFALWMPIDS